MAASAVDLEPEFACDIGVSESGRGAYTCYLLYEESPTQPRQLVAENGRPCLPARTKIERVTPTGPKLGLPLVLHTAEPLFAHC